MNKKRYKYLCLAFLALLFLKGIWPSLTTPAPSTNLYLLQADAFLHGQLDIGQEAHDAALFEEKYYVVFPPFPAVILMPFVWMLGTAHTNVTMISLGLCIASALLLYRILKSLSIDLGIIQWSIAGFFMGTAYWMMVKGSYGVWHFAHIACVATMLLSIHEALRGGNAWLVGLYFGLSVLSRHMAIYALPFLLVILPEKDKRKSVVQLLAGLMFALTPYLLMNWARFHSPFDSGYAYILQIGFLKARLDSYGLFSIYYLPFNFIYLFLQGFHVEFQGETFLQLGCLDPFGTSLTFASPFIFAAFWAREKKGWLIGAWISILLMVLHTLFYYSNGFYQVNAQRFTMDFMPILIILTALGMKESHAALCKFFIAYSIILNIMASFICAQSS